MSTGNFPWSLFHTNVGTYFDYMRKYLRYRHMFHVFDYMDIRSDF